MADTEKTLEGQQPENTSGTPTKGNQKADVTAQVEALQAQLRQMQATKDREVAAVRQEAEARARELAQMREQMEQLIADPAAKQEFRTKRLEAELQAYRAKDGINQHRQLLVREYGVPTSELESTDDPAQMTDLALRYWRKQSEARSHEGGEKTAELEKLQESGGHDVSTAPAPTPNTASASLDQIERQIKELRAVALQGGRKGEAARLQILGLMQKRNTPTAGKTRL